MRRHLADKAPVSDLADEFGVQPSQIHFWVKQVSTRLGKRSSDRKEQANEAKIAQLEETTSTKNELMEANVRKKANGEL